jgi:polyhydroxyalkanoate synthase subunit PhaC
MAAIEVATKITGSSKVHAVGYCLGGTMLAVAAAAMARDGDDRLATMTLLAAQTDFEESGELKLFVDDSQLAVLDDMMAETGVLEGSRMGGTFHLLRSNDLIWARVVNRYLLGKRDQMDALWAWSSDTTRLPARMHSEYLRSFYLENALAGGRFKAAGGTVALQDINVPAFAVGTEWDYADPWRSVYKLQRLTSGPVTFVLTNGGHNQGVIAPPTRSDRHYRMSTASVDANYLDADRWLTENAPLQGSWWPAWFEWLGAHSGPFCVPPSLGNSKIGFAPVEPAPGIFVHG